MQKAKCGNLLHGNLSGMVEPEERFVIELLEWHKNNARDLPWRRTRDPYKILIAQLLLQRTRAERVAPVYREFLKQFPSAEEVPDSESLHNIIDTLGLTSRVERIRGILSRLRDRGGNVPSDPAELDKLLGGAHHYVREAILLYAFDCPLAPIDRPTARVISRVFLGRDLKRYETYTHPAIVNTARKLVSLADARPYNYALLDFAALVCTAKPKHSLCPITDFCKYFGGQSSA